MTEKKSTADALEVAFALSGDLFVKVMILIPLAGGVGAYLIPFTALSDWPWGAKYAEIVAQYVPAIDKLGDASLFPEVTRLYMALQWSVVWPLAFLLTLLLARQPERLRLHGLPGVVLWMAPIVALALFLTVLVLPFPIEQRLNAHLCEKTYIDFGICLMGESRFWLGLLGSFGCELAGFMLGAIFHWPRLVRMYYESNSL